MEKDIILSANEGTATTGARSKIYENLGYHWRFSKSLEILDLLYQLNLPEIIVDSVSARKSIPSPQGVKLYT